MIQEDSSNFEEVKRAELRRDDQDNDEEVLFYNQEIRLSAKIISGVSNEINLLISKAKNLIRATKEGNLLISMIPRENKIKFSHNDTVDNSYFEFSSDAEYQKNVIGDGERIFLTSIESLEAEACRSVYDHSSLSFSLTAKGSIIVEIALKVGNATSRYKSERLFLYNIPENENNCHIVKPQGLRWGFTMDKENSWEFIEIIKMLCLMKKDVDIWFSKVPNGLFQVEYRSQEEKEKWVQLELEYGNEKGTFNNHVRISWSYKSIGKFFKLIPKNLKELIFIIDEKDDLILSYNQNSVCVIGKFENIVIEY